MISPGLILRALGWQAVGTGMVAKGLYDKHLSNQSERRTAAHYAPVDDWWARYGVPEAECDRFLTSYLKSLRGLDGPEVKNMVLGRLRECVKTDDSYVNGIIQRGGGNLGEQMRVVILYYASKGRAARMATNPDQHFPMAGNLSTRPGLEKVVLQLLRDNGVPDVHWYCNSIADQEARLSELEQ